MPVTRASSRQASQQRGNQPYTASRSDPSGSGGSKNAPKSPSNEIIVLSSDDDEPPPKGTVPPKKSSSRKSKRKAMQPLPAGDVLEISSDEESKPKKASSRKQGQSLETTKKLKTLECAYKKLEEDIKQCQQQLASSSLEIEELKRDFPNKNVLVALEEHTTCEVCSLTMWCPYTLPECGHSFCETCLVDWFGTIQAQHMTANPQLDDSRAALATQLHTLLQTVPNLHAYGQHGQQHLRAVLVEIRRHRPGYTCPSCRKEALNKPVEDFRLKNLINQIAGLLGETNARPARHQGSGPFDHFFAVPTPATK